MAGAARQRSGLPRIRYAQCWEDAAILLEALQIQRTHVCLSIASAGDNTLALLSRSPARVIAIDVNPAQLACLELRVAAYQELEHSELLTLMGGGVKRNNLYRRCRPMLSPDARRFWDAHSHSIARGIAGMGRFERYLSLFRRILIPLIHSRARVRRLLAGGTFEEREAFYCQEWNTIRWRLFLRIVCSRFLLGRLARYPGAFAYTDGRVSDPIQERIRHALITLNPAENPYLHWILRGRYETCLPFALRPENFEAIRCNLDRLEWRCTSLEEHLNTASTGELDACNLSDVFEYMPIETYHRLLLQLCRVGRPGARLAYWNMMAPRRRPEWMAARLDSVAVLARDLHRRDKAFFYSDFVVEEILG